MGWKKIYHDDLDACRSLDLIIEVVQALKAAVQRGSTLEGKGEQKFSWKDIWCPEVSWTLAGTISNIGDATVALRRLKVSKESIDLLSASLDDAIHAVSGPVIQNSHEVGLAYLPDDVLAHIFEIYHLSEPVGSRTPHILSSVSKRFRRITIHIPLLWEDVSPTFSDVALSAYTARCQRNRVYAHEWENLEGFFDRIHPHHRWEEFHLRFWGEEHGHEFFGVFSPRVESPFNALKTLSICNHGLKGPRRSLAESLLYCDRFSLTSWQFPRLTCLMLKNILPSTNMSCPNVTYFEIIFSTSYSAFVAWDFVGFRNLLQSTSRLEFLVITFENVEGLRFSNLKKPVDPLTLPSLASLEMTLRGRLPLLAVALFMDLLDTERLAKLHVCVNHTEEHYSWQKSSFWSVGTPLFKWDAMYVGEWMIALFMYPARCPKNTRHFSAVTSFALDVSIPSYLHHPPFYHVFAALPNVQHLSLKLPDYVDIDLDEWREKHGGLQELQTLHIDEYPSSIPAKYTTFFSKISKSESWRLFERLEVVSPSRGSFRVEALEEHLDEKLVRIGGMKI